MCSLLPRFFGFYASWVFHLCFRLAVWSWDHADHEGRIYRSSPGPLSALCQAKAQSDPFRVGVSIYMGRTSNTLCPVAAMLAYLANRPQVSSPLFIFRNGTYLTRDRLVVHIRQGLLPMGMDPSHHSGHSFRIGAATTAAQVGVEDSVIKMLGHWESASYQRYIRTPRDQLAAISSCLTQV